MDERRSRDFVRWSGENAFFTNSLYRYSPKDNHFRRLSLRGAFLPPRTGCAVALLDHRVFIHGGKCDEVGLTDFFVCDLKTLELTEIKNFGFPTQICHHSATSVSDRHVLFVGEWPLWWSRIDVLNHYFFYIEILIYMAIHGKVQFPNIINYLRFVHPFKKRRKK